MWIFLGITIALLAYVFGSLRQVNDPNFLVIRRFGDIKRVQTGLNFVWAFAEEAIEMTARTMLVRVQPDDVYTQDRVHVLPKFSFEFVVSAGMTADEARLFLLAGQVEGIQPKAEALLREFVLKEIKRFKFLELFRPDPAEKDPPMNRLDKAITTAFRQRCHALYGVAIRNFNLEDVEPADREVVQLLQDPEKHRLETEKQAERKKSEAIRGEADAIYLDKVKDGEVSRARALERVKTEAAQERRTALEGADLGVALGVAAIQVATSVGDALIESAKQKSRRSSSTDTDKGGKK